MNVNYKDGKVSFDLQDLLQSISDPDKLELVESLSCEDAVIYHVASQIIHKWTENGYSGGTAWPASSTPYTGLDWAWREVAKLSGEIAAREIKRLESALKYREEEIKELQSKILELHRSNY
jgi:hypothetical protein